MGVRVVHACMLCCLPDAGPLSAAPSNICRIFSHANLQPCKFLSVSPNRFDASESFSAEMSTNGRVCSSCSFASESSALPYMTCACVWREKEEGGV